MALDPPVINFVAFGVKKSWTPVLSLYTYILSPVCHITKACRYFYQYLKYPDIPIFNTEFYLSIKHTLSPVKGDLDSFLHYFNNHRLLKAHHKKT